MFIPLRESVVTDEVNINNFSFMRSDIVTERTLTGFHILPLGYSLISWLPCIEYCM